MARIDLTKCSITGTTEIMQSVLRRCYSKETKPELEGFEKVRKVNSAQLTL